MPFLISIVVGGVVYRGLGCLEDKISNRKTSPSCVVSSSIAFLLGFSLNRRSEEGEVISHPLQERVHFNILLYTPSKPNVDVFERGTLATGTGGVYANYGESNKQK